MVPVVGCFDPAGVVVPGLLSWFDPGGPCSVVVVSILAGCVVVFCFSCFALVLFCQGCRL